MPEEPKLRSPYGPVRVGASGWAPLVSEAVRKHGAMDERGKLDAHFAKWFSDTVVSAMFREITEQLGAEKPELVPQAQASVYNLTLLMPAWAHYVACGRQIFEFAPGLTDALKHTDLGETRLEGLQYPYPAFYVRFGAQPHLGRPWEDQQEYVDGAFFSFSEGVDAHPDLAISLTSVLADGLGFSTPGTGLTIPGKYFSLPVQEALDLAVADMRATAESLHTSLQETPTGPAAQMGAAVLGMLDETVDVVQRALPLFVNALYYLSDPPTVVPQPGSDTPAMLREKVDRPSTVKSGQKAISALLGQGYAMVRLCGKEFETEATAMRGSSVHAHWRRGHYRDQRHGPQLLQVKRIWIRPVRVHASPEFDPGGHLYVATDKPRD